MLWGEVLILNTDGSFFSFEADLFKFFIVFTDNLKKISLKEEQKNQVFSVYNDYLFSLERYDEKYVNVIFKGQKKSLFDIKKLLQKTEEIKQ